MVRVSVIIPVYKVECYVERCIRSIMLQTYTEGVECIIVDDCTPDCSMEIVERLVAQYDGNIQFKLLYHECNRGLAAVRNTGMKSATGDYIIHIDSDDYVESDMLEKMYEKAVAENADIVIADYYDSYEDKEIYQCGYPREEKVDYLDSFITKKVPCAIWNKLIKRDCILDNNLRCVEGVDIGEDYLFSMKLFLFAKRVSTLPHAFVHYTKYNSNSYTYKLNSSEKTLKNYIELERCVSELYVTYNLYDKYLIDRDLGNLLFRQNIILRTAGKLQKKYNSLYNNDYPLQLLFCRKGLPVYWKMGLLLASCRLLFVYNMMRYLWKKVKCISVEYVITFSE